MMSNQFDQCESTFQNTEFKWTHSANWLLINCYLDMKDEFRDPRIRKKDLWIRISDKFREIGYEVPYELLDKKFRNLKSSYYQVKERKQHSSHKSIKWEYYKVFDELLKGDEIAAVNFANANSTAIATINNDPRLTNFRSSVYVPIESRKRKRVMMTSNNKPKPSNGSSVKFVTIEPANVSEEDLICGDNTNSEPTRGDTKFELDMNEEKIMEDSHDSTFADDDDEHDDSSYVNRNRESFSFGGKKLNVGNLEARKLHAETRYFNKKADYFEKQTMCLDIQRKLMIMQAHKLKLEIEQMKNYTN